MSKNIILCGVGGQGTVLASKLISATAMRKGIKVMSAETIGMSQRGGSVTSHIRIGEDIYSPLISKGSADLIIGFEPGEAVRMLPYLKKDGTVIVSTRAVMPVTASLKDSDYSGEAMVEYLGSNVKNLTIVDTDSALEAIGSAKVLNLLLLGVAISKDALGFTEDEIKETVFEKVPQKFHELNLKALDYAKTL